MLLQPLYSKVAEPGLTSLVGAAEVKTCRSALYLYPTDGGHMNRRPKGVSSLSTIRPRREEVPLGKSAPRMHAAACPCDHAACGSMFWLLHVLPAMHGAVNAYSFSAAAAVVAGLLIHHFIPWVRASSSPG
jgi:hypothetical protein